MFFASNCSFVATHVQIYDTQYAFCVLRHAPSHNHGALKRLYSLVTGSLKVTVATQHPAQALHPEQNNNNKRSQHRRNKVKQSCYFNAINSFGGTTLLMHFKNISISNQVPSTVFNEAPCTHPLS